ncbi:MAG: histidine kinase dimerization/phospho-acceptor domain-containing protein [Verrucomicrobiota bacterium JB023]|nr:histidine kinase dimerization/phospho-acceptor domain-containing protein [Verrucomicrobiota bacterium JB023]
MAVSLSSESHGSQAFYLSSIPQLIVSNSNHRLLESNKAAREWLLDGTSRETKWWETLRWCERVTPGQLCSEFEESGQLNPTIVTMTNEENVKTDFRLHCDTVDGACLISLLPLPTRMQKSPFSESVLDRIIQETGEGFHRASARLLCEELEMDYAVIARRTQLDEEIAAQSVAFYVKGVGFQPNFIYAVRDTPCWDVYRERAPNFFLEKLQQQFPDDEDLVTMEAQSYLGSPIFDKDGLVVGHIALLSKSPIREPNKEQLHLLKLLSMRIAVEFRRNEMQEELRKASEAAQAANEAKTRFLANMSHELRTPLNAVLGYSRLLVEKGTLPPSEQQTIDAINRNGKLLLSLINEVLDMSRIELGHSNLKIEETNLRELHQDLEAMFRPLVENHAGSYRAHLPSDLPEKVLTDGQKIKQILINLLSNAVKYAAGSTIDYTLTEKGSRQDGRTILEFRISDDGPGLDPGLGEKLFIPFERGKTPMEASVPGTGLGLAIAKSYAQEMDGDLVFDSRLRKGCSFILTIPVQPITESATSASSVKPEQQIEAKLVLVTDDNDASREIVRRVLQTDNLDVIEAEDGEQCVETTLARSPDLILMDVRMPRLNGDEASKILRNQLGNDCPPIIGLTGDILGNSAQDGRFSVFDTVIAKPFEFETLKRAVHQYLTPSIQTPQS